jgi:hypothetical protein
MMWHVSAKIFAVFFVFLVIYMPIFSENLYAYE